MQEKLCNFSSQKSRVREWMFFRVYDPYAIIKYDSVKKSLYPFDKARLDLSFE